MSLCITGDMMSTPREDIRDAEHSSSNSSGGGGSGGQKRSRRRKRSHSRERHVEALVAVDVEMRRYHGHNLEHYILTLMAIVIITVNCYPLFIGGVAINVWNMLPCAPGVLGLTYMKYICSSSLSTVNFNSLIFLSIFYARKQLLLSARLSHRNSVRPSVCPSVHHTGGSVKIGAS